MRRLPNRRANIRLAASTRALLTARAAHHAKPKRAPIGKIALTIMLAVVVAAAATGGIAVAVGAGVIKAMTNGLPDPAALESLTFNQPTIIYDRTGKVELARFQRENRSVVAYDDDRRGPQLLDERRVRCCSDCRGRHPERAGRRRRTRGVHDHPAARARAT